MPEKSAFKNLAGRAFKFTWVNFHLSVDATQQFLYNSILLFMTFLGYRKHDVVLFHPPIALVKQKSLNSADWRQCSLRVGSSTSPTKPATKTPVLGPTERKAREKALSLTSSLPTAMRKVFRYKLPAKRPTININNNTTHTLWRKRYHEAKVKKINKLKSTVDKVQVFVITGVHLEFNRSRRVM